MLEIDKTPKQIVSELDRYVIGQNSAKKAIAVALRNRYRRMHLTDEMREEVTPKNVLMIGSTGVGKTEIARRLAKIVNAPFVKVEATKFTEIGYVGRDVESMVRDLVEVSHKMEQDEMFKEVRSQAVSKANERLATILVAGEEKKDSGLNDFSKFDFVKMMQDLQKTNENINKKELSQSQKEERAIVLDDLKKGLLDNKEVTISMADPSINNFSQNDMLGQMGIDIGETLSALKPKKVIKRTMPIKEAREVFIKEESEKLIDSSNLAFKAIKRAENTGIIFVDEIDKVTSKSNQNSGSVSREGVQRDILPIVEGSQIKTKYGLIKTDHILFIASGAFHESKPSDLIAELQGRFPIRVELSDLSVDDFVKILTEPSNALIKQYVALIGTDNVRVTFTIEAIKKIAELAYLVNHETENIGARRLHTILEKLLEDILYEGPDMNMGEVTITEAYVDEKIGKIAGNKDLSRYIL